MCLYLSGSSKFCFGGSAETSLHLKQYFVTTASHPRHTTSHRNPGLCLSPGLAVKSLSKPFLVRKAQLSASKTRLFVGPYIVDLYAGQENVYYSISKSGSSDIISLGSESSITEAESRARWTISKWICDDDLTS